MNIEELLKMHSPTEIEKMLESACPLYVPRKTTFSGVYLPVHALANSMLAVELQEKLSSLACETEQKVSEIRGRLDTRIVSKGYGLLNVEAEGKTLAILEMKTGSLKLVQPACYAYNQKCPVILIGLKTCEVQVVTPAAAEKILKLAAEFIQRKEALKASSVVIKDGVSCRRCSNESCGYASAGDDKVLASPELYEQSIETLGNLPTVVEKVVEVLKQVCARAGQGVSNGN